MDPMESMSEGSGEIVERDSLAIMQRAEIDVQISTAKRYPRSMQAFERRAMDMVSLDHETAESCIYRRPVGQENGKMKHAEGLSVRMAEIVAASYGNIRVAARLIEQTPTYVKAQGMAHDLESNTASTSEVVEATTMKDGSPMSPRMRVVIAKAALAKARRDATFQVVPRALCKRIEREARHIISGGKTLEQRREAVSVWLSKLSIDPRRVFAALGVVGLADLGDEELTTLTGLRTAIKEGEETLDTVFPPPIEEAKQESKPAFKPAPSSPPKAAASASVPTSAPADAAFAADLIAAAGAIGITGDQIKAWLVDTAVLEKGQPLGAVDSSLRPMILENLKHPGVGEQIRAVLESGRKGTAE